MNDPVEEDNSKVRSIYRPILAQEIRLLRLDTQAEHLCGSLETYNLDSAPEFTALSYTWGTATDEIDFVCNSKSFLLRLNLHKILRLLQTESFEGLIWVDAICINQNDDEEKVSQIRLMQRIYMQAITVVAWLSTEAVNIARSCRFLLQMLRSIEVENEADSHTLPLGPYVANTKYAFLKGKTLREIMLPHLSNLFSYTWYSRVWTVQEMLLPRDLWMRCGKHKLHWTKVNELVNEMDRLGLPQYLPSILRSPEDLAYFVSASLTFEYRGLWQNAKKPIIALQGIYEIAANREARHPQDYVLGFLGLLGPTIASPVLASRRDGIEAMFMTLTKAAVAEDAFPGNPLDTSLWWLHQACAPIIASQLHLPSWCPDYTLMSCLRSVSLQVCSQGEYHAGFRRGSTLASDVAIDVESGSLMLPGFVMDRVTTVIPGLFWTYEQLTNDDNGTDLFPLHTHARRWNQACQELATSVLGEEAQNAVWQVLCGSTNSEYLYRRGGAVACRDDLVKMSKILESSPDRQHIDFGVCIEYIDAVRKFTLGRQFFATSGGRIGLATVGVREGDFVCVLISAVSPFVLRPIPDIEAYRLVGIAKGGNGPVRSLAKRAVASTTAR